MQAHVDLLFGGQGGRHEDHVCHCRVALAALALAGCDRSEPRQLQGWVEAELIFVSPDEQGRVETVKVREGDHVTKGESAVHRRRRSAAAPTSRCKEAAVTKAQQAFDRAKQLLTTAAGTQKTYDDARSGVAAGQGQSRLVADAARAPPGA